MLNLHTIKPAYGAKHSVKRVGRGNASGHGTSSTRGGKGQTARSGGSRGLARLGFKRLLQSTPKLRGFKSLEKPATEIYLSDLNEHFNDGETITMEALVVKSLAGKNDGRVKIISTGKLSKKLFISGVKTTKGAVEKIKALGGEVK